MYKLLLAALSFSLAAIFVPAEASTTIGVDPINASRSCNYCLRCEKLGGACGYCKSGLAKHPKDKQPVGILVER